jgi:hypothetical protein
VPRFEEFAMPDDIRTDHPVSQTERKPDLPPDTDEAAAPQHRQVGPESEVSVFIAG